MQLNLFLNSLVIWIICVGGVILFLSFLPFKNISKNFENKLFLKRLMKFELICVLLPIIIIKVFFPVDKVLLDTMIDLQKSIFISTIPDAKLYGLNLKIIESLKIEKIRINQICGTADIRVNDVPQNIIEYYQNIFLKTKWEKSKIYSKDGKFKFECYKPSRYQYQQGSSNSFEMTDVYFELTVPEINNSNLPEPKVYHLFFYKEFNDKEMKIIEGNARANNNN